MRIRLPLTLAIIDGFLVGVGGATFVIPLDRVVECVELPARPPSVRDCMDLRGEVLPFIRLRSLFGIGGDRPRRENVVVVEYAGMKIGLVVDALMGEFQTVIKPLGRIFEHVAGHRRVDHPRQRRRRADHRRPDAGRPRHGTGRRALDTSRDDEACTLGRTTHIR